MADRDGAGLAEKPAAMVAGSCRPVARMKITNGFLLLGELDRWSKRRFPIEFRENIGLHLGPAGRALARLAGAKQTDRQRFTAVWATQIRGHLS